MWEVYLAAAMAMFEDGAGCVYQLQDVRDRRAVPLTRDYLVTEEARLRAAEKRTRASDPATARQAARG